MRKFFEPILMTIWQRRCLPAYLLSPLSLVFSMVVAVRRFLYATGFRASTRLPVPVIIVGNIFVGGTGKTPLTIWLVQMLRQAGYAPGVISRGYASRCKDKKIKLYHVNEKSLASDIGDEPLLIASRARCPVVVSQDRVAAAKELLKIYPEVNIIISDDGLQYYQLERDIEIILFDDRGIGNGWLLPAGPLRESVRRRRDFTVVNSITIPNFIAFPFSDMQIIGNQAKQLSYPNKTIPLDRLGNSDSRIVAAAGIGNPQRFFSMLINAGLQFEELTLPDHYNFLDNPFITLEVEIILITEKDAVKCRQIDSIRDDARIWFVPVFAQIDKNFSYQILEKLHGHSADQHFSLPNL